MAASGSSTTRGIGRGRRVGMRLWLGAAFAGVSLVTASSVYLFVNESSAGSLRSEAADLAVGRASRLADDLQGASRGETARLLSEANTETFEAAAVDRDGNPMGGAVELVDPDRFERGGEALQAALDGRRFKAELPGDVTVAAAPIFGDLRVRGAVLSRSTPPPALSRAIDELRSDSLQALAIAIAAGVLFGFVVASLISIRVKRLARSAEQMAAGRFDVPLSAAGGDEIGDLTRSLDTMRKALRQGFDMLATERDRLSATLDGLTEAVIVVGEDGEVRFSNPAARTLVREGRPAAALIPTLRRAGEHGSAANPALRIGGRLYEVQGRRVPAEHGVLLVVRDRTEELKRDQAEREFVSNAAHELRNPLAGISSAIEVLRGGAKEDPADRDRFLERLADDAERMTRLIESLLTLAWVEAVGEREKVEVVDVTLAVQEALAAVEVPEGIELEAEVGPDLVAEGDSVLVRQVAIGLLTNACNNTPVPGRVTLRAFQGEDRAVTIEVEDTGRGIPAEEQDRVFERFYRGSGAQESEGFGLGLPIAKRMVDVMGGELGLRSSPGRGSLFWVQLRVAAPTATPVA
jgi:signal transduction histidine kinase